MSVPISFRITLLTAAFILPSCGNSSDTEVRDFLSDVEVPVAVGFDQFDAEAILVECGATDSAIEILDNDTVRFEPSVGSSVDTAACVTDRLITSGQPPLEDFPGAKPVDQLSTVPPQVMSEIERLCVLPQGFLSGPTMVGDAQETLPLIACANNELRKRGFAPIGFISNPVESNAQTY